MALPFEKLGCTLLFFAGHQDGRYISGHLGDGLQVLVSGKQEDVSVFSHPENGRCKYETYFVTSFDAQSHLRLKRGVLQGTGAVLLMSDGAADCLYNSADGTVANGCRVIASWLRQWSEKAVEEALRENMAEQFSLMTADDMSLSVILWEANEEDREV